MIQDRIIPAKIDDEVNLIAICDPHLANSSPPSWKADYRAVTEAAIVQVLDFAVKIKADAIIWAGDFYHRKSAERNPIGFITECVRLLKRTGIPNTGISGNHDEKYGSLKGLVGQPLENLIEAGVYQLLDAQELLITMSGFWSVRIAGASYEHGKADACRDKKRQGATWLVSVGHFWFGPEEGVFNGEPLYSPKFLGQGEPDIYVIGHKHDDQGVIQENGKTYVVPGSISLTGEKAADSTRRPAAAHIKLTKTTVEVKTLRPKMPPIQDLVNMEKRAQVIEENRALEAFVNNIATINLTGIDPKEILNGMTEVGADVRKKVEFYLELANKV